MEDKLVKLQVGEKRFITTKQSLEGSDFLSALPVRWKDNKQDDGSYFIDADPDIFIHILRYLRHEVLPVFYDDQKGHNFPLYQAVLRQAGYFGIPPLEKWLKEKAYLKAVKIEYSTELISGESAVVTTRTADIVVEYHPAWKTNKVYICPREIYAHRGNQNACGRQCRNAQGDRDDRYEDELVLKMVAIHKRTKFDEGLCLAEG